MTQIKLNDGSKIIICNDFEQIITELKINIRPEFLRLFKPIGDEFLLDDTRKCIREAYIASEDIKTIVLYANKYRIEAQNALLAILEENPKNINFILLAKSKSILLTTIKSRLMVIDKRESVTYICDIDILNLNDKYIFELIDKYSKQDKNTIKEMMYGVWGQLIKSNIKFNISEQDVFYTSIRMLELNTKPIGVLSNFFLTLRKIIQN
jgi:DNA polymerase-3 subunit delta'